jgi:hypothetical protein
VGKFSDRVWGLFGDPYHSIYTSVSSDYKTGILRQALDRVAAEARSQGGER